MNESDSTVLPTLMSFLPLLHDLETISLEWNSGK